MHRLLNEGCELEMMKTPGRVCKRDFYNVRKVCIFALVMRFETFSTTLQCFFDYNIVCVIEN